MEFSIREIIRDTRVSINTRLDMLEMLIQNNKAQPMNQHQSNPVDISNIEIMLQLLTSKINSIEDKVNNIIHSKHEELPSITVEDSIVDDKKEEKEMIQEEEEEKEMIQEEEEVVQEEEEVVQEEEEVVQEEEEEVVQEEQELTEFEYKGMVLYRDGENKVYQMDEDGELVDTPIGVWNETKQKVLRI